MPDVPAAATVCPYCLAALENSVETISCPSCQAIYHQDCWAENGGCAVYGCARVPVVENRKGIEVPVSYWGQENKPCPACGQQILAAALRCRHCSATFNSARPEDAAEFQVRTAISASLPLTRRTLIWIFVFSVVPFLAPIGAAWGYCWYRKNGDSVRALPTFYGALFKVGHLVSLALSGTMVVLTALYIVVRGH